MPSLCLGTTGATVEFIQYSKITVNTLQTGDADLRFYITTVQDG